MYHKEPPIHSMNKRIRATPLAKDRQVKPAAISAAHATLLTSRGGRAHKPRRPTRGNSQAPAAASRPDEDFVAQQDSTK